mgnify:CR=1 FL=1
MGFAPIEFVEAQIQETKKLTDKPFGINVILIPDFALLDKITKVVEEERPAVVYADTLLNLDYELANIFYHLYIIVSLKLVLHYCKTGFLSPHRVNQRHHKTLLSPLS